VALGQRPGSNVGGWALTENPGGGPLLMLFGIFQPSNQMASFMSVRMLVVYVYLSGSEKSHQSL